jgi:predicted RNA binding protein YcfA (HicA-like mRNA interferase family)
MPARLKACSGKECVRILCNKFGFSMKRQRGSHVVLVKETAEGKTVTVVPLHRDLKLGTLKGVLELAKVKEDEFAEFQ